MSIVHVTEAEAIRDIETLLSKVEQGDDVQIERGSNRASIVITLRDKAAGDSTEYLSEFRLRHPESLDRSKWE